MSTRRLILAIVAGNVKAVWFFAGSSQASQNHPGGIGPMVLLSNGSIVLRNADVYQQTASNIYEAFGPGNLAQQTKISDDKTILPLNGSPTASGTFSLTFGINTTPNQNFNVSAATLATALNALASIVAAGGVMVSGANGGPFTVTFNVNGVRAAFASGFNTLGIVTSANWVGVVNISTTQAGDAGTPNIQLVQPAICSSGGMALVIKSNGYVDPSLLGTTVAPTKFDSRQVTLLSISGVPQYPNLPTGIAAAVVGGKPCLFCAGLFQSYWKKTVAASSQSVALIDMTDGSLVAGFAGGAMAFGTGLNATMAPRVFSDGAGVFGIHSVGTGWSYTGDLIGSYIWTYTYTFGVNTQVPTGQGTFVSVAIGGIPGFIPPVASYRGTGINGPIIIAADGSIASQFTVARFSICTPISNGAGKFLYDSILVRPNTDSLAGNVSCGMNQSLGVVTITLQGTDGSTGFLAGGSIYGWSQTVMDGSSEVPSVRNMFPDCTVTFVSTVLDGSTPKQRTTVMTLTPPANSTYTISLTTGNTPPLHCISSSDGATNLYSQAPFQQAGTSTNAGINFSQIMSSAIARQGSAICHVMRYVPSSAQAGQNFSSVMWRITIPGVVVINVGLNYARGLAGAGGVRTAQNVNDQFQVSIVPFNGGFAIALPHSPFTNSGTPYRYTWNPAKAGAVTTILKSPIILIDAAGNVNTTFDTDCFNNFFSFTRADSARFGPASLLVNGSSLYFGSLYMPGGYLNLSHPSRQLNSQGDIINAPTWGPFFAPGAMLEVLCACDTSASQVLPAAHP